MRLLAAYAVVILGFGSLATTGCGDSSGDDATGGAAKGASGGVAGSAGGGAAGGGAGGGGGGAAGGMSDVGIFGDANGEPFSLTEMVRCESLLPGMTLVEASFADGATSSQLMHITLMASAPGTFDCEGGSSISYAPAYVPPPTSEQYFTATQGIGSCSIILTEMPVASGDSIRGTFSASLEPDSGTGPAITISNGRFSAKLQ